MYKGSERKRDLQLSGAIVTAIQNHPNEGGSVCIIDVLQLSERFPLLCCQVSVSHSVSDKLAIFANQNVTGRLQPAPYTEE